MFGFLKTVSSREYRQAWFIAIVADAIQIVQPYGVDVESGVEVRFGPGRGISTRSYSKIAAFMAALGRRP